MHSESRGPDHSSPSKVLDDVLHIDTVTSTVIIESVVHKICHIFSV